MKPLDFPLLSDENIAPDVVTDLRARGMQFCAEHAVREHNMKAFGPELYIKMQRCLRTLEEGTSERTNEAERARGPEVG